MKLVQELLSFCSVTTDPKDSHMVLDRDFKSYLIGYPKFTFIYIFNQDIDSIYPLSQRKVSLIVIRKEINFFLSNFIIYLIKR